MKQSDPLQLVGAGSFERPGPVGRLVRLSLGIACLYGLYELILHHQSIIERPVSVLPNLAIPVIVALLIINYVVNIGFGRSWGRWPSNVSVVVGMALAFLGWMLLGTPNHPVLGFALWLWLVCFCAHLGISFLLAALIATPGCEMRSIPELLGRISGRVTKEHHCPAALISRVDIWENRTKSGNR
jgi:hypothetical protein